MNYSVSQYQELSKRFSEKSFLGKIMLIRQNPEIFYLQVDEYSNFFLRLRDEEAMKRGLDLLFIFPQEIGSKEWKSLFDLININVETI